MESTKSKADSIRTAVASISTCTLSTAASLTDLLLPKVESQKTKLTTNPRSTKHTAKGGVKSRAAAPRIKSAKVTVGLCEFEIYEHEPEALSAKERSILATEIINATLKSLNNAIKSPAPTIGRRQASKDTAKTPSRKALRRSNSLPQSPLQTRSLNRVASSPSISNRDSRSSSISSAGSSSYKGTAECARIAFACLRTLQATKISGVELPPLQLENGMSVLIGRLVSLGLDDIAIKELRILKRRLEQDESGRKESSSKTTGITAQNLADLLDFGKASFTDEKLGLVIATQLQVLRLMTTSKNPKQAEDALPILQAKHSSSPTRLLLMAAKNSKQTKLTDKITRQMQSLSEILLSLCPSVSPADDDIALEKRLSVSPEICIQLQTIALHNRFLWWGLAGHEGDLSKDIFDPFLRCLSAFARRSTIPARQTFDIAVEASQDLNRLLTDCSDSQPRALKTIIASIYRLIGSLAKEAGDIDLAIRFTEAIQPLLNPEVDSDARRCSIVARLVSLRLLRSDRDILDEELLLSLLDSLERGFKGDSSEIDDLMTEISNARRSAISLIAQHRTSTDTHSPSRLPAGIRQMCESLVFFCPRLSLRYLGNAPDIKSTTKDIVRYEQRKQFITKSSIHAVDSALFLVKVLLSEAKLAWELMDSKLQDCLLLLDRFDLDAKKPTEDTSLATSYYVRISNFYYTQFLDMRRDPKKVKDGQQIRTLRRCIDCIRGRSSQEKKAGQLVTKLERLAEFCKDTARYDELFKTLSTIRDEMIEDGVLATVAERAASMPLESAWNGCREATILGRTVQSLVKVQLKYISCVGQLALVENPWSNEEKAIVLEQQLDILCDQTSESDTITNLLIRVFEELVSLYNREQYPLRRIRVLLRLVPVDCDKLSVNLIEALKDLEPSQLEGIQVEGTHDEGLLEFLVHLKAMATTIMELQESQPKFEVLKQGLSTWSSIRNGCKDMVAFNRQVDVIPDLIAHLHTIADWLQIKGFNESRVAALRLIADIDVICASISHPDEPVLDFTELGIQWLQLGYSGKAGLALDKAKNYNCENGVSAYASLYLHISYSEYLIAIGSHDKIEDHLACAHAMYSRVKDLLPKAKSISLLEQRTKINLLVSKAYKVYSIFSLEIGMAQTALTHAKQSVRLLRRSWANIEEQVRRSAGAAGIINTSETDKLVGELSLMSISDNQPLPSSTAIYAGTSFWTIITPLFCSLNHLSQLYSHHGMFQETIYYAEQAYKLAQQVQSNGLLAVSATILAGAYLKGAVLDIGLDWLGKAERFCAPLAHSKDVALLTYHHGKMHGILGNREAELAAFEAAEKMLDGLTKHDQIENIDKFLDTTDTLGEKLAQLSLAKPKKPATRKTTGRPRAVPKGKTTNRPKSPVEIIPSVAVECPQLLTFRATILREKAQVFIINKRCVEADALLQETGNTTNAQSEIVEQNLAVARQLLAQSLEQMNSDPVYSVLQDSTISFPAVVGIAKLQGDRLSATKTSPSRKNQVTRGNRDRSLSKSPVPDSFFDKLCKAQNGLTEAHSIALNISPVSVIYSISTLLNSVAILLSAAGQVKGKPLAHPGFASSSIEITRNLAFRRELKVIQADPRGNLTLDESCWPQFASEQQKSSNGMTNDLSQFQKDYIDIIPKPWTVISISISDSRNELSITKLQAGHNPFVLRLPLGRHNSIDADEEVFGFEQGQTELFEIIQLANESAHDAKSREGREAKISWWEEREALDTRLRDLLENIEKVWLGGFTGIFSQHARRPDLLARFQKTFQNILDRHLPSRQKSRKRIAGPRVTLDSRILELFIGLGDASCEEADFSEPLTDLLYFVVDVLQFHGELNAYAEIDFDLIVVETMDALRCYHEAVHSSRQVDEGRHTILILDKALHSFPWESLPCMDGLAVSRLPSLACLRDRIISEQETSDGKMPEGHYINRDNGSYILNPGGDLKHTQATFQKNLQSLAGWEGICNREPSEDEFKSTLQNKDLLLYFGHGSGAQYIRAREIKKLEKCAVTVLMGCSSGALVRTGEFEPYGPPINYMHAGSHALVATLWDVTDKDIDRFAKSTFEHWGLWETEKTGHRKGRNEPRKAAENMSLVEAVAKSRNSCKLRYLNAASVCVYGVPVYFK